jgi:hypothetical protein
MLTQYWCRYRYRFGVPAAQKWISNNPTGRAIWLFLGWVVLLCCVVPRSFPHSRGIREASWTRGRRAPWGLRWYEVGRRATAGAQVLGAFVSPATLSPATQPKASKCTILYKIAIWHLDFSAPEDRYELVIKHVYIVIKSSLNPYLLPLPFCIQCLFNHYHNNNYVH